MRRLRNLAVILLSLAGSGCVYHSEVMVHKTHTPYAAAACAAVAEPEACCLPRAYPGSALWQGGHHQIGPTGGEYTSHRVATHRLNLDLGLRFCGNQCVEPCHTGSRGCLLQAPRPHHHGHCGEAGCESISPAEHAPQAASGRGFDAERMTVPVRLDDRAVDQVEVFPYDEELLDTSTLTIPQPDIAPSRRKSAPSAEARAATPGDDAELPLLEPITVKQLEPRNDSSPAATPGASRDPMPPSADDGDVLEVPRNEIPTIRLQF